MAISVSTLAFSSFIPTSACSIRRLPSKVNGLVTTPTVSEPSSFATLAMIGAAPVPVPPPMPAVMKIMSASPRYSRSRSTSSWAARLPTSGLPPAPSPRVSFSPSCILIGARLALRACASVLAAMKSTPGKPAAIMVFTALPPPPPIPTTLIRAAPLASTNSIIAAPPPLRPGGLEELPEPPHHPLTRHADLTEHALAAAPVSVLLEPVEDETDCRRIHGTRDGVNQAAQMKRRPEPHGQPEDALGERRHVLEHRPATGQDHPGGERLVAAGALDLGPGEHQHLLGARLDHRGERAPVALLQVLGLGGRGTERGREVAGHVPAAHGEHRRVADRAGLVDDHVDRPAAQVDQGHAQVALLRGEHRLGGGERAGEQVAHVEPGAVAALDQVLPRAHRAGHDVDARFEAHAGHADRLADAVLVVDDELLRQDVEDLLVGGEGDGARGVHDPLDVPRRHLAVADRDHAMAVEALDVAPGRAGDHAADLAGGHQLRLLDRPADRLHRLLDVDDDTLAEPA